MKIERTTTTYVCDVCGKTMEEPVKSLTAVLGWAGQGTIPIEVHFGKIYSSSAYSHENGDVCPKCVIKALDQVKTTLERETK